MNTEVQQESVKDTYIQIFNKNKKSILEGSPEFYKNKQIEAFKWFEKLGFPSKRAENYKYTYLEPYFNGDLKKYLSPRNINFDVNDMFRCDVPELDTQVILLVNGFYYNSKTSLNEYKNGVIAGSFKEAVKRYPELVEKHYSKYASVEQEGLVALNTSISRDGIFIYIPRGIVMEQPFQLINILISDENELVQPRNLFIFEEDSEANIVVCDHSLSAKKFLTNSVTEVYLAPNARFDYTKVQNESNFSTQVSHTYLYHEKNSQSTMNLITLHGGLVRNNIYSTLNGEGSSSTIQGLFLSDKGQHVDNFVFVDHAKPNTTSNQLFKGILDDYSSGAFSGKILVQNEGQKTQAYQKNNNILLTDDAKMNSKPQLEIYADDVKCSHGATSGQLDEDALFYLRSRGINIKEARLLLMFAFAHEVIEKIKVVPLKERIDKLVNKRLRGELSPCNKCAMHCG